MTSEWRPVGGPLWAVERGPIDGATMVFVHGFTQTGRSWEPIADRWVARGYRAVVVDLPGHGGSANVDADLVGTGDLLLATCGAATYVGYSLGGRACLHAALAGSTQVERLVVIGAQPGIESDAERDRRRRSDDELADRIVELGVERFLDEWTHLPLFGDYTPSADDIADRRRNTAEGLARSLRRCGTGTQQSLWDRLPQLSMPVLALAGALDTKFATIAERISATVTDGRCALVPDAAHAAHLQQPELVDALIDEFVRSA